MANFGTSEDFNRVAASADGQQQKREEEAKAAQQRMAGAALEVGPAVSGLLGSIPAAIVAAQRAELARLTAIDPHHARAAQIESTIGALTSAAPVAKRVVARATRALDVARSRAQGFHGFVTASDGTPLKDAVVHLGDDKTGARAKTADDGYFFIPLSGAARPASENLGDGAHVTITNRTGQTLYEDPVPVNTALGFAYREYVVEAPESDGRTRGGRNA